MKRIYCVTEGQTETNFVKRILSPYFSSFDTIILPATVITSIDKRGGRMYKGGMLTYQKAELTIHNCLNYTKKDKNVFVTTMFDYYRLPKDTPGFSDAHKRQDPYRAVDVIETEMCKHENLERNVFFPYIQLHEFEALIFSNLSGLAEKYFDCNIQPLIKCLEIIKNPELINNGCETAPSKRILKCIPHFDKATTGIDVLAMIALDDIRSHCSHFNDWICKLENL